MNQQDTALQCREIFRSCGLEPIIEEDVSFENAYGETYLNSFDMF